MTLYVGIDQSYSGFGIIAWSNEGWGHDSALQPFPAAKYETPEQRLLAIERWLRCYLKGLGAEIGGLCMEGYAPGAKFGREMAGELGWAVKRTVYDLYGPATVVAPTAVKKYATGKGSGVKKNLMLLSVFKRWDVEFNDDNLADAYVLARIAAALDGQQNDLTVFQKEVLAKL